MAKDHHFTGPVFVVGMPRSGTKLLESILNRHPLIAITENESHCIPYFFNTINKYGDLKDFENFGSFYNDFSRTTFFQRLTKRDSFIDKESWHKEITSWSYAGIIEAFYQLYAKKKDKQIWGDKTPSYMLHLPLLKSLFPRAKFIHIIRDARDYCLSINKAWNKNIYRAAQRWHDSIRKCQEDAKMLPSPDYLEVRYEQLIDSPERTTKLICGFLDVSYNRNMTSLQKPTENLGDAKNFVGILKNNYGKWEKYLAEKNLMKIERICGSLLSELGYPVYYHDEILRLSSLEMFFYKILDGWNLFLFEKRNQKLSKILFKFMKSNLVRYEYPF